jgi:hypothetical protein
MDWSLKKNKAISGDASFYQALLDAGTLVDGTPSVSESESASDVDYDYYVLELLVVAKKTSIPRESDVRDSETSDNQDPAGFNLLIEILKPVTTNKGGDDGNNTYETKDKEVVASLLINFNDWEGIARSHATLEGVSDVANEAFPKSRARPGFSSHMQKLFLNFIQVQVIFRVHNQLEISRVLTSPCSAPTPSSIPASSRSVPAGSNLCRCITVLYEMVPPSAEISVVLRR